MAEADRRLARVARRQYGRVTRQQALGVGISSATGYRMLERDRLEPVHRNVARVAGAPRGDHQRLLAAVLACGPGTLSSHSSAAWLWGVDLLGWTVEVTTSVRDHRPRLRGVTVHRPTDLVDLRPQRRAGIPVTDPLRLLVDVGASRPEADVERALDQLVVRGVVTVRGARAVLSRHAARGRAGVGPLRAVLDRWAPGEHRPDSTARAAA